MCLLKAVLKQEVFVVYDLENYSFKHDVFDMLLNKLSSQKNYGNLTKKLIR